MRKAVATTAAAIPMMSAQGHPGDEKGSACEPECFSVWRRIALRSNSRRRLPHLGIIRALGITNGSQESASVRGCLSAVPTFGPSGVKRTCRPRRLRECEDCRYLSVSVLLVDGFRVAKDTRPTQRWFICEPRVPHGHPGAQDRTRSAAASSLHPRMDRERWCRSPTLRPSGVYGQPMALQEGRAVCGDHTLVTRRERDSIR